MKRTVTLSVMTLAASAMVHPANAFFGVAVRPPTPGVGLPGPIWQIPSFPGVKFSGDPGLKGFYGAGVTPGVPGPPPRGPNGVYFGVGVMPSPPAP